MSTVFLSISTRTTYVRLEVSHFMEWIEWTLSNNQIYLLTHRYSQIINAFPLLDIQIRMSSSGYINVFTVEEGWFFSRRVKFDSGFNVAVCEVSRHGPKVVYCFTGIRKWVVRWKRPFWFSKKVNITLLNWSMPYQGGCSQFLISSKGFWFVHLPLEK